MLTFSCYCYLGDLPSAGVRFSEDVHLKWVNAGELESSGPTKHSRVFAPNAKAVIVVRYGFTSRLTCSAPLLAHIGQHRY